MIDSFFVNHHKIKFTTPLPLLPFVQHTMKIIYTFDFKTDVASQDREYMMLGVSIQSALESDPSVNILLFTADKSVKELINADFPQVEVRYLTKEDFCNLAFFTCAGHARVDAIFNTLREFQDDVLYVDNDTLIYPGGLAKLKKAKTPVGYAIEPFNTNGNWLIRAPDIKKEVHRMFGHKVLAKPNINNGVQYFPYNDKSLAVAERVMDIYRHLSKVCDYYYGLDMTAFSLAMYEAGLQDKLCFKKRKTDTVWHAYMVKQLYIQNLVDIGVTLDHNGQMVNHQNVFKRLKNVKVTDRLN